MARKRILLVVDRFDWIMGTIAKEIVKWVNEFDFFFISAPQIERHTDQFLHLAEQVDIIHWTVWSLLANYHHLVSDLDISHVIGVHHFLDWSQVKPWCEKADAVVTASKQWETVLIHNGVPPSKICVVRYGVDTDRFRPLELSTQAYQRMGVNKDHAFVVGFVATEASNDHGRKGADILIEALKIARRESEKEMFLLQVGEGWKWLHKELRKCGIHTKHMVVPAAETLVTAYNMMHVYIVPSRVEGGPVTLLESLACGTPVITTPIGIAPEVIEDGVNGIIVPTDDAEALAGAILALARNPLLLQRLQQNARATIISGWQWKQTLPVLISVYHHLGRHPKTVRSSFSATTVVPAMQRRQTLLEDRGLFIEYLAGRGEIAAAWSWALHTAGDAFRNNPIGVWSFLWHHATVPSIRWLYRGVGRHVYRCIRTLTSRGRNVLDSTILLLTRLYDRLFIKHLNPMQSLNSFIDLYELRRYTLLIREMRRFDPWLSDILADPKIKRLRPWEYACLLSVFRDFHELSILDIGTGPSTFGAYLASKGATVVAFDLPNPMGGRVACMTYGVPFINGNMLQLPFKDSSFDLVLCISTIEHLHQRPENPHTHIPYTQFIELTVQALKEMARVVRPGGYLYITSDMYDPRRKPTDVWWPEWDPKWQQTGDLVAAYKCQDFEATFIGTLKAQGFEFDHPYNYDFKIVESDPQNRSNYRGLYITTFSLLMRKGKGVV